VNNKISIRSRLVSDPSSQYQSMKSGLSGPNLYVWTQREVETRLEADPPRNMARGSKYDMRGPNIKVDEHRKCEQILQHNLLYFVWGSDVIFVTGTCRFDVKGWRVHTESAMSYSLHNPARTWEQTDKFSRQMFLSPERQSPWNFKAKHGVQWMAHQRGEWQASFHFVPFYTFAFSLFI
jgi:hypothetical protein